MDEVQTIGFGRQNGRLLAVFDIISRTPAYFKLFLLYRYLVGYIMTNFR